MNTSIKKGAIALLVVLGLVIVVETSIIVRQTTYINHLKKNVPYLMEGEEVTSFDLTGLDNQPAGIDQLRDEKVSLIFIFEQPCTSCNKNLMPWKKMAKMAANQTIPTFGIVLDEPANVLNAFKNNSSGFPVYVPNDPTAFIEQFRVRLPMAQTIILKGRKVIRVKFGNLGSDDFLSLVQEMQALANPTKGE